MFKSNWLSYICKRKEEEEDSLLEEENTSSGTVQSPCQKEMFSYVSLISAYLCLCVVAERDQALIDSIIPLPGRKVVNKSNQKFTSEIKELVNLQNLTQFFL